MRTNIDIDDELLTRAMEVAGTATKKATVEKALREFVKNRDLRRVVAASAGIGWEGDLDEMRRDRNFDRIR